MNTSMVTIRRSWIVALALLSSLANAQYAIGAPGGADDDDCERGLLVSDRSETPGRIQGPAKLALQHTASRDTVGVADIAVLYGKTCATEGGHQSVDYGLEYHLDSSSDAPLEQLSATLVYTRSWSPSARDSDDVYRKLQVFGEFGRNIEAGRTAAHLGAGFSMFPTMRNGEARRGLMGGEFSREDGEDSSSLFVYEIVPQADYFVGYQPSDIPKRLDAAYVGTAVKWEWVPYPKKLKHLHGVYVSAEWVGQRKLWGDNQLPDSVNRTSASIGYRFVEEPMQRYSIAIALDYKKGRLPDSGFVADEGFVLALKYKLGINR